MGYYIGQILAVMIAVRISMYLEKRIRSLWKKSSSKTNSKQRQEDITRVGTTSKDFVQKGSNKISSSSLDLIIILLLLCTVVLLIAFVMYLAGF